MHQKSREYIRELMLERHVEGGYYRETYRGEEILFTKNTLSKKLKRRSTSTLIYFLLDGNDKSHFHKLKSDEIWHFYDGCDIKLYSIDKKGNLSEQILGKKSKNFQVIIPKNTWFAAELTNKKLFALVGCTVSPGFDYKDFEIGKREELINQYPNYKSIIKKFTKC
ncbi:cupin domain-containing protein [Melioribacteraceae bacterium 4301-Me]|uniref:cupin domain-containing protein n=1 Tax=Pyranulibacter aquaticus TaxID=3163344 RepID=UPI003594B26E